MKIVLANGCFDVLHVGHLWHLRAALEMGDELWVALTLDAYVNKGPGRPVNTWKHRAELLRELRCVSKVVPSISAPQAIRALRPDVFVKGIDYDGNPRLDEDRIACEEVGAELRLTTTPKRGSGDIIRRMREAVV